MTKNHLEKIESLIALLIAENLRTEATQLQEAVAAAATGIELLMSVRFTLKQIQSQKLPKHVSDEVTQLIEQINSMLGHRG